jgi:hypothetical protein
MNHYIETSYGTIALHLDLENNLKNTQHLLDILKKMFIYDSDNPFEVLKNEEGLFLIVNLEDPYYGNPEFKIKKSFSAQLFDIEPYQLSEISKPSEPKLFQSFFQNWCLIL